MKTFIDKGKNQKKIGIADLRFTNVVPYHSTTYTA